MKKFISLLLITSMVTALLVFTNTGTYASSIYDSVIYGLTFDGEVEDSAGNMTNTPVTDSGCLPYNSVTRHKVLSTIGDAQYKIKGFALQDILTNDWTIEFSAYALANCASRFFNMTNGQFYCRVDENGALVCGFGLCGGEQIILTADNIFTFDTWNNIIMVNDATLNRVSVYLNGALVASANTVSNSNSTSTDTLYLGAYGDESEALIDHFNIFGKAAIASEIEVLYSEGLSFAVTTPAPEATPIVTPASKEGDAYEVYLEGPDEFEAGDEVVLTLVVFILDDYEILGIDLPLFYNEGLLEPTATMIREENMSEINGKYTSADWSVYSRKDTENGSSQIVLTVMDDEAEYAITSEDSVVVKIAFTAIADSYVGDYIAWIPEPAGAANDSVQSVKEITGTGDAIFAKGSTKVTPTPTPTPTPTATPTATPTPTVKPGVDPYFLKIITNPNNRWYVKGADFDPTGLTARIYYRNGVTRDLTEDQLTVTEFDSSTDGVKKLTVSAEGVSNQLSYRIYGLEGVRGISIVTKPSKIIYDQGEKISIDGAVFKIIDSNGNKTDVIDNSNIKMYGATTLTPGKITVTFRYDSYYTTCTMKITEDKLVTKYSYTAKPTKRYYSVGEEIELEGFVATQVYFDSTYDAIDNSLISVSGFDSSVTGIQKVTLSYESHEILTYSVSVS